MSLSFQNTTNLGILKDVEVSEICQTLSILLFFNNNIAIQAIT